jgi:hypothetical protein
MDRRGPVHAPGRDRDGKRETLNQAPVGVYFGRPGVEAADPYFGGAGPRRTGCISCGNCNNGCGHNAKNKLTTNYLYLAEKSGVEVHDLHEVYELAPLGTGGFEVRTRHPGWAQRAASGGHPDSRAVGTRPGQDPAHAGIGVDHLRRLARPGDQHRARLLGVGSDLFAFLVNEHRDGAQKHPTAVSRPLQSNGGFSRAIHSRTNIP